jgi:large subunit ribosomal protein L5
MIKSITEKIKDSHKTLKEELGIKNTMAMPRIFKVVVSSGTGKAKDKKRNELVADRLAKITGQHASPRAAKQAIATFKTRQGDIIGYAVTLRGKRMTGFLDKLWNIAFPRTRDFKGFDEKSVDELGNLTIGLREQTIFPETADEDIKDVFGLSITIVTTAKDRAAGLAFFKAIGFPFKKPAAK